MSLLKDYEPSGCRAYADLRGKSASNVTAVIVRSQFDGNEEVVTADRFES